MWDFRTAAPDRYHQLNELARENRKHPTEAETLMWEMIRDGRFEGLKFLRQHIIDDFLVDFVCRERGIIIEVDGGYHLDPAQQEDDQLRTEKLEALGFNVIRFRNEEVMFDYDNVQSRILRAIEEGIIE